MSGLILKLSPKERILINGAVIENGDRRTRLAIKTPDAHILRLRDAIHPDEAKTPVRRVCYAVQLVLSGDVSAAEAQHQLQRMIDELAQVFCDEGSQGSLRLATEFLKQNDHYRCLKALRNLLAEEDRLMVNRN
jgi:flagellar protein FlbT